MTIDLLLIFLVMLFVLLGFIRGFLSQVLSLLCLFFIVFFAQPLAIWMKESSGWLWAQESPGLVLWGLSALSILSVFLIIHGIVALVKKEAQLTRADRWLGAGLGLVKGFVISLFLALGLHLIPSEAQKRFTDFNAEAKDSYFMAMAKPLFGWNFLSTFEGLSEIRDHLKLPERPTQSQSLGPWAHDSGIDPE